ncbi:MAG: UDP-N-acetylmuramate--L-alanine ligase [Candidatus Berkelbacteria bacterium]|nr:UDP-N-acetylmuramate--L-alanine ligase [Candidatus Berkelbacteria bacterium]
MRRHNKTIIVLTGGGTAGHTYPLFAVAKEIKKIDQKIEFLYIGSGAKIEKDKSRDEHMPYQKIFCGKLRKHFSIPNLFQNIFDVFKIAGGFCQAIYFLLKIKPTVVFSKGGFVSLPVILASYILKVPVISHESDILPGLTTKISAKFAKKIAVAFPQELYPSSIREKSFYSGIPLNDDFINVFKKNVPNGEYILVMGGSLGAVSLNSRVFEIADKILEKEKIVHLTGAYDFDRAKNFKSQLSEKKQNRYEIMDFSNNMSGLISNAKLVISRAGATSIFEIAACRRPAIFVPIPNFVTVHQEINALYLKKEGLAEIYFEKDPSEDIYKKIEKLLEDKTSKVSNLYFPESAQVISQNIIDLVNSQKLKELKNVFMIGINGVSMKAFSCLLSKVGVNVKGSDIKMGGHSRQNINLGLDLVIYSSAADKISPASVEHERARELKIPIVKRAKAIGWLMGDKRGIAVSGMHGKTTVASLLARIFENAGLDPSYLIGAPDSANNKTYNLGSGGDFIVEACEYDDSFLAFPATIGVILNIEKEHLDYFKNGLEEIKQHFSKFIQKIYPGGVLIYSADDPNVYDCVKQNLDLLIEKRIKIISFGFKPSATFSIRSYSVEHTLCKFQIKTPFQKADFQSAVIGRHFASNAAAALAVAQTLGVSTICSQESVMDFVGAARRFEYKGSRDNVMVYDDYAHHPTEITATLNALSELYPKRRKVIIYQPHQQSRMNEFFEQFVDSFKNSKADFIGVLPVYKIAGRDENAKHSSEDLVSTIKKRSKKNTAYFSRYEDAVNYLNENLKSNDILMTMGATDVFEIGEGYLKKS